ncbi:hypothetical protein FSP39_007867 [Pinctada imbricata]|uniref:Protein kinase domain-containing protein n=1 Tax=Pinctada imbricata TaxID=66713 RepID=A0AA89CA59_PINIB|nr:hypothetical protein FSP39_007867 [Pinctada imbricata]
MPFGKFLARFFCRGDDIEVVDVSTPNQEEDQNIVQNQSPSSMLKVEDGHGRQDFLAIGRVIKRGQTATIWKGRSTTSRFFRRPREVALKIREVDIFDNAITEYKILRSLNHSNIIKALKMQFWSAMSHRAIIQLEYVQNGTLFDYVVEHEQSLSGTVIIKWKRQLLSAIRHIHHEANLVHGNLTSNNILLDNKFRIKVAGFGSASMVHGFRFQHEIETYFVPPELVSRKYIVVNLPAKFDPRSFDIWCAGINLYFMLTQSYPFDKESLLQEIVVHQNKPMQTMLNQEDINRAGTAYVLLLERLLDFNYKTRITIEEVARMNYFDFTGDNQDVNNSGDSSNIQGNTE